MDPKDTTQVQKIRDPWAPSNVDITIWKQLGVEDPFIAGFIKEKPTLGMYIGANAEEAMVTNPTTSLLRMQQLREAEDEPPPSDENIEFVSPFTTTAGDEFVRTKERINEDQWKNDTELFHPELNFSKMASEDGTVTIEKAKLLKRWKEEEVYRREVFQRYDAGFGAAILGLGTQFFVSALDPINLASAFVPVVRAGAMAGMTIRLGRTGAYAVKGALEGAVGQAMVEPIILAGAKAGQMDYNYYNSATNIAFGTFLGAGLHTGAGMYSDALNIKSLRDAESQMRITAYSIDKDIPIGQQLDIARRISALETEKYAHIRDLPALDKEYKITYTEEEIKARQAYDAQTKKFGLYDSGGRIITNPEARRLAIIDRAVEEEIGKRTFSSVESRNQAAIELRAELDKTLQIDFAEMRIDQDFVVRDAKGREVMDPIERKRIIEEEIYTKQNEEKVNDWLQNNKYDEDELVGPLQYRDRAADIVHRLPFNDAVKATVSDILRGKAVSGERMTALKKALAPVFKNADPRAISNKDAVDTIKMMSQDYLLRDGSKKVRDRRLTKEFQDVVSTAVKEAVPEAGLPKLPEEVQDSLIKVGATTQEITQACDRDVAAIKKTLYARAAEGDQSALNAAKNIEMEESKLKIAREKRARSTREIIETIEESMDPYAGGINVINVKYFKQTFPEAYHKLLVDYDGDRNKVDDLLNWILYEYRQDVRAATPEYIAQLRETGLEESASDLRASKIVATVNERMSKVEEINLRSVAFDWYKVNQMETQISMAQKWAEKQKPGDAKYKIQTVKEAVNSYIWGSLSRMPGARVSISSRMLNLNGKFQGGLINDLERTMSIKIPSRTLWDRITTKDPELNRNIARELWEFDKVDGKKGLTKDSDALAAAEIFHKYQEIAIDRTIKNGVTITKLPGYIVRQNHDRVKVSKVSFEDWKNEILPRLNERETFGVADKDEFLRSVYDNIVAGKYTVFDNGSDVSIKDNLGLRLSAQRQLFFKSADDWYDYNLKFGFGEDLLPSVQRTLERAAKNNGVMEALGPAPYETLNTVIKHLKNENTGNAKMLQMLDRKSKEWKSAIDVALGISEIPDNPTIGAWGTALRALENTSKLGSAFLSALTDVPFFASEIHFQGGSLLKGYYNAMTNVLKGRRSGDQRQIARLLGVGLDGARGTVIARFTGTDTYARNIIERTNNLVFKISLLNYWTDAQKTGFGLMLSNYLADNADLSFDLLNKNLRRTFEIYGITSKDWDIIRTKGLWRDDAGTKFITTDGLREFEEIEDKFRMYVIDSTERAVPTPGLRERVILKGGIFGGGAAQAGTIWGEAVRLFSQFKSFPLTVTRSVLGRELITREGFGSKIGGVTNLIIGTTILGYGAAAAKDLSKGRKPQDPLTWDAFGRSFIQGGGLGILSDFLLATESRYGAGPLETVMGPTYGTANDLFNLMAVIRKSASDGIDPNDDTDAGKAALAAIRVVKNNTPFANLWWARSVIDHALWNTMSEAVSPGYKHRMEIQLENRTGQEYWWRP